MCRSARRAGSCGSRDRRRGTARSLSPMRSRLRDGSLSLPPSMAAMAYRRITAMLRREGWRVNHKRVERIWRREGLKVPAKKPKRGRLWFNDGSCIRLRPAYKDHVRSYDFVADRTKDGRPLKTLTLIESMSTPGSVWPSRWRDPSSLRMCLNVLPSSSCSEGRRTISAPITGRGSPRKPFGSGWAEST